MRPLSLLALAALSALAVLGCSGAGNVGEACERPGSTEDCVDGRTDVKCKGFDAWIAAWTEIKG